MKKIFKATVAFLVGATMASCTGEQFGITGQIEGAADSTLYFENISLKGVVKLDSVKLDSKGQFAFRQERPEAPDFYRLRIDGKVINLSIDSTETVSVSANYANMATEYTVEGSDNCQRIKELSVKQMELQRKAMAFEQEILEIKRANDSILALIDRYKKEVTEEYVFVDPRQSSAYFALFQTVGRFLIFDPYTNREDMKAFAAVATCWDAYYPEAERTKNLYNITIKGITNYRQEKASEAEAMRMANDTTKVVETGIIDIALQDINGQTRRLTDLKGKVVLLDFHLFNLKESPARIILLRELYTKYHKRGFEIYQVSLDDHEHFWTQQVEQLPWISVRDPQGINSINAATYNVRTLPDFFLIDRENTLVTRSAYVKDLEKEIEKLLN